jgi:hypothetical protein
MKFNIIYKNGIREYIKLTREEINILKTAVNHNNGFINLRSDTEAIKSLIIKGLIEIKFDENTKDYDLSVSRAAKVIFK